MSTRRAVSLSVSLSAAALALVGLAGCGGGSGATSGAAPAPTAAASAGISPTPLPDLTFPALSGSGELRLRDLKGPAVLNVWASWCGPCREELPRYAAFAKAYAGKVDVVGLDFQDTQPQAARDLLRSSGVTYPSYRDADGQILRLTRSRGIPQVVLVDAQGRAVFAQGMVIRSTQQLEDLVATHLGVRR
ncbi:hypothetical protein GCM10027596_06100 [Nocardioides korecus]